MKFGLINAFNFIILALMLAPNIIYGIKNKNTVNKCKNKAMNIIEQIGRYGCILFMVLNIGIKEFEFGSEKAFFIYCLGNAVLILAYLIVWGLFFIKERPWKNVALSIIPTAIFLLCGITLGHNLLIISSIILAVGHPYVSWQNVKC